MATEFSISIQLRSKFDPAEFGVSLTAAETAQMLEAAFQNDPDLITDLLRENQFKVQVDPT